MDFKMQSQVEVRTTWYENGMKESEERYVNGKLHGVRTVWDENGQKMCEETYVNGVIDGLYQSWHDNGQKMFEVIYTNGRSKLRGAWHRDGTSAFI